ncbi:serine/threonine protein kinase [Rivularia sp. PCC 7116]|uniref:protein kinase domain-containing protein n=1 Tax=Rivularia sp. PCC 7116 TaxID=373994 RepID=UPI00029EF366|nr:YARHG domain-containing protein [Rivularia sp. PCC 7116]AFY52886.1 serine/threonine protein kinase [Rivularia sp. PCC 7116]
MMSMLLNNRYQIIRTLGSGGFGDTFLAEDTQMPSGRSCVIKQLKPIENNPQIYQLVQERFAREAAILEELGGLNHQIPTLYAYFCLDEKFYLVQEWIEGNTLSAKIQHQGLFNESDVREIVANILLVLQFVHSKRIIHRDIKPDNIILRQSDGKPVLIDFGAVRETMATVVNSQGSLTRSIVIGTPGYMPSEQAAGRAIYSSDLYSLGLTMVYLLSGKSPQQLETNSLTGEITWESEVGNISPALKTIINKAIAYHPRERYSSALEMLEDLRQLTTHISPTIPFDNQANNSYQSTVIANKAVENLSEPQVTKHQKDKTNNKLGILPLSAIIGSVVGMFSIGSFWLLRPKNVISQSQIEGMATPQSQPTVKPAILEPQPSVKYTANDFSWLSSRRVTDADLDGMNGYTLDLMRNSIFARHGRRFNNPGLQQYFDKQSWYIPKYSPQDFPSNLLSNLERMNVESIAEYQDRTNKRFFGK